MTHHGAASVLVSSHRGTIVQPIIVRGNEYQFAPRERVQSLAVESVMLVWCKQGHGAITCNGTRYPFFAGQCCLLPWHHDVVYQADDRNPYLLEGVHCIPEGGVPLDGIDFGRLPVSAGGQGLPGLTDCHPSLVPHPLVVDQTALPALIQLAGYIVAWFQRGAPTERMARSLGELFAGEVRLFVQGRLARPVLPERVRRVIHYQREHPEAALAMAAMAQLADCSISTLTRDFRTYLNRSPLQWLREERLTAAATLIATTRLPLGLVGQRVGIPDPFYFSRLFTVRYGVTPTAYRRASRLLSTGDERR
jgi:AraC-like DNA-binding protein